MFHVMTGLAGLVLSAAVAVPVFTGAPQEAPAGQQPSPADIKKMMDQAKKFTQPGEHHKKLEKFIGKWNLEMRFFMGGQATPAEKATSECTWLMDGRWIRYDWNGTMMGQPARGFGILGYDGFKMSYVLTMVSSLDTAMNRAEGDMDPSGKALIMYGTLDEYLTGEHDKMVKYVWRFLSDDKMVLEVHDLPIGENNAKVMEISYTRVK